jgi:hypothetical protein
MRPPIPTVGREAVQVMTPEPSHVRVLGLAWSTHSD